MLAGRYDVPDLIPLTTSWRYTCQSAVQTQALVTHLACLHFHCLAKNCLLTGRIQSAPTNCVPTVFLLLTELPSAPTYCNRVSHNLLPIIQSITVTEEDSTPPVDADWPALALWYWPAE